MQSFHFLTNGLEFCYRKQKNPSQTTPDQFVETIIKFHQKLLRERKRGKLQLEYIANIGQISLSFVLNGNRTSDTVSANETCNYSQNI